MPRALWWSGGGGAVSYQRGSHVRCAVLEEEGELVKKNSPVQFLECANYDDTPGVLRLNSKALNHTGSLFCRFYDLGFSV